eukprot:365361-Chlamydomonas_euryale.AAC.6
MAHRANAWACSKHDAQRQRMGIQGAAKADTTRTDAIGVIGPSTPRCCARSETKEASYSANEARSACSGVAALDRHDDMLTGDGAVDGRHAVLGGDEAGVGQPPQVRQQGGSPPMHWPAIQELVIYGLGSMDSSKVSRYQVGCTRPHTQA